MIRSGKQNAVPQLTVDDVFDIVGHAGFMQVVYAIVLGLMGIFGAHHMILNLFDGLDPSFVCYPKVGVDSASINVSALYNACPQNDPSKCVLSYNSSYVSFAREWDLVCNQKYWVALVQSIFMGGVMTGALVLGSIPDRVGRRRAVMASTAGTIMMEGASSFAYSYVAHCALRFLGGVCFQVTILAGFVLSQELLGSSKRGVVGMLTGMIFPIGIALLAVLANLVGDWRTLTLLSSVMGLYFIFIPCFVPESPRWLLTKGKTEEAKRVLEKLALENGTAHKLPQHWELILSNSKESKLKPESGLMSDIFKHKFILKITLILMYLWFLNGMVYYALTLASGSMKGNVYVITAINGLIEIPANLVSLFTIEKYGRVPSEVFFMISGGISCILIPAIASMLPNLITTLALYGKLCLSCSYSIIYIQTAELYPTYMRNSALGIVSVASRIGGMASPLILILNDIHPHSHFLLLGLVTLLGGILSLNLPETRKQPMPETIQDVYELGRQSKLRTGNEFEKVPLEFDDTDDADDEVVYELSPNDSSRLIEKS